MSDHDERIARAIRRADDGVAPITLAEVTSRGRIDLDGVPIDGESVTDAAARERLGATTGGPAMVIDLERVEDASDVETSRARRRPRWPVAAAAAALLAVVAVAGWAATSDDERVDLAPAEDAAPTDPLAGPTALVDDFIDVYNGGDPEAVAALFVDEPSAVDRSKHTDPAYQRANDRWTRTGPCRPDEGDGIVCPIRRRDDFHGAAGLSLEEDHVFRFDDDGLLERLVLLDADPWAEHHAFRADFRAWATAQHPEVAITWFPPVGTFSDELADMPTAEGMPAALGLVMDFVAQSERWGS